MAIQTAKVSIENIDDQEGIDGVMTALKNIDGVTAVELDAATNIALIRYDDTDTTPVPRSGQALVPHPRA